MKSRFFVLIIVFVILFSPKVYGTSRYTVKLSKCIDGDTARFILDGKEIKARFIGINTPEYSDDSKEPYGKEASEYTCQLLTSAKKVQVQYDPKSSEKDKYDRDLLWVFVDNELLQKKIIEKGYGKVAYLYGDYLYIDELEKSEQDAKSMKLGIWNDSNDIVEKDCEYESFFNKIFGYFNEILKKMIYLLEKLINSML